MAEWTHYFNIAVATGGLVAALIGLLVTLSAPYIQRWERRLFHVMFALLSAYIACDLVEQITQYFLGPNFAWLARTGVFFELLFSVAIVPLFTAYLLRCANKKWRTSPLLWSALAVFGAYIVVLVSAQFSDAVYYFSLERKCVLPGTAYPALAIPPLVLMVINLIGFVGMRNALSPRRQIAYAICTIVPLIGVFVQAAYFGLSVLVLGTSISAFALLELSLADQTDAHIRRLEQDALRNAQIRALQMRPHFIYNIMTSIYYLCEHDPARAQQVTLDFTNYLRANFDAVAQEGLVPFSKELEHTRAYLEVERARLEDDLTVDIDCPYTAFRLPPLTLQPLVENAVKHGADPELDPLHVRITTREEGVFWVISVEDTGPGFDAPPVAGSAHALDNIRKRLAACGSSLHIAPHPGGGTVATIRVPHQ